MIHTPKKVTYAVGQALTDGKVLVWVLASTRFTVTLATKDDIAGKEIWRTRGTYTQEELDFLGFIPSTQRPLYEDKNQHDDTADALRYFMESHKDPMENKVFVPGKVSGAISHKDFVWLPNDEKQRVYYVDPLGPHPIIGCLWKEISPEKRKALIHLRLVFKTAGEAKQAYQEIIA